MPPAVPLTPECILLDLRAQTQEEVLAALADALCVQDPELQPRRGELLEAMRERERLGSTAAQRVALPHVKLSRVRAVRMVVAVSREGVDFRAPDGERVHVFFSLVRPLETAEQHLGLLRWIASVAEHQDFVHFARQARTRQQVLDLLHELTPA